MPRSIARWLAGCLFALGGLLASAARAGEPDAIDAAITSQLGARHVPGAAVAIVHNGKVVKEVVIGTSSLQLLTPVTARTMFQIASVTKIFTGLALAVLAQQHKLSFDDPVGRFLPALPVTWQSITLRQLAAHIAGLPDMIEDPDRPMTDAELRRTRDQALALVTARPVVAPAGVKFAYDQTSYFLLASVIEAITRRPFTDAVNDLVFAPARMTETRWADARAVVRGRTDMYSVLGRSEIENALLYTYPPYLAAAAGINTSIRDFEQLAIALERGHFIDKPTLSDAWRPTRDVNGAVVDLARDLGATGTISPDVGGFLVVGEDGAHPREWMDGGLASSFLYFPEDRLAIIVLTNLQGAPTRALAEQLARFYLRDI